MPVSTATPVKSYTGNGVATVFAYDFRILKDTDLKVTVNGVTKTLTTDYTVSGVGDSGGGNVTFVSAPANGAKIVFEGNASYDRTTDYQRGGGFDEETVDKDFDRAVILIKQIKAILDRVPQIAAGTTLTQPSLPDPVAQRFLRWKSDLSGFENLDIATIGALAVSDFAKTYLDDADAATTRGTLGLGTAATKNTGNAAAGNVPLNSDIQGQTLKSFTTGGTATAYTLTPTPAITANTAGIEFDVTFHTAAGATPTLAVSGLAALALKYRDSTGAKQAVTSTQVPSGWRSKVVCDGTDWVVREVPPSSVAAPVRNIATNLVVKYATAATATITADELVLRDASGNSYIASSVNVTANIATAGVNGLDTGAEAANTWYYLWVIYNGTTIASLISTSSTAPTMPSGYTYKALVGSVRNDGSSNFIEFAKFGNRTSTANQVVFSGQAGTTGWTAQSLAAFVPPTARAVNIHLGLNTAGTRGMGVGATSTIETQFWEVTTSSSFGALTGIQTVVGMTVAQQVSLIMADTGAIYRVTVDGYFEDYN